MTNHYELLAIVDGRIPDSELETFKKTFEDLLKKHVSSIHYVHNAGRRKLAYPINHQGYGTYLLCEFDAPGEHIKKLERAMSLTTELLRHCIVRRKTVGTPTPFERREEEMRPRDGRPTRKTQDEELLGRAPLAEEAPVMPSAPPVTLDDTAPEPAPEEKTESDEQATTDDTGKKKAKKVSYEDLDKKLNELLSDDII
ncbi:30S ribosomal protein S6 [Candidatus Uhrbacteria bacterium]|nr:30S ribosomal protein S6 [Candidatus Uhrbacteria bacterium]